MIEQLPFEDTSIREKIIQNDPQMMEAAKYLTDLKFSNRKQYNKLKKQGRKFSDTIMKKLK